MSLDMTVGSRNVATPAAAEPEAGETTAASRPVPDQLMVAAVAAFGAMLTAASAVLLYLR